MADRRPDDPSVAPSPSAERPAQRPAPPPEPDRTGRINQADASSAPIVSDEPEQGQPADEVQRPSGADRFAAVLAATTGRMRENAATGAASGPGPTGSVHGGPPPAGPVQAGPRQSGATQAPPAKGAPARKPAPGTASVRPAPRTRKARLRLTHVDPWSVMKTAFLLSIALGIVTVVAVAIVWSVLGAADVWGSIDKSVNDVLGDASSPFRIEDYLGMSRVMGFTLIVAVADVILVTVIATLAAFLYNLAAALLGGLEVVLAEEDR